MPIVQHILKWGDTTQERLAFWCPACGFHHFVIVASKNANDPVWDWNRNFERPTITPSIRVSGGEKRDHICHTNVTDGKIIYHPDSTHAMKGQTLDVPPMPPLPGEAYEPDEEGLESLAVSAAIRLARMRTGVSRRHLAELMGVSYETLRNWEYGRVIPKTPFDKLAHKFECVVKMLLSSG